MRLGVFFVAACMVLIAGSAAAIFFLLFGFSVGESMTVAVAVLTALALFNSVSTRTGARAMVGNQLNDLSRGNADMARQVAEVARGFSALQTRVDAVLDKTRATTGPLAIEIGELGVLSKQLLVTFIT